MIYDRIKELCDKSGISVNKLESEIGVSRGSLCKIDKHKPSSEKIQKIADLLHTTPQYLLTGEQGRDVPEFDMYALDLIAYMGEMKTNQKQILIEISRQMTESNRRIEQLEKLLDNLDYLKNNKNTDIKKTPDGV